MTTYTFNEGSYSLSYWPDNEPQKHVACIKGNWVNGREYNDEEVEIISAPLKYGTIGTVARLKEPVEEKNFGTWLQKNYFPKEEPVESQEDLWEQVEQAFMDYMPNELKEYLMKNFFITRKPN